MEYIIENDKLFRILDDGVMYGDDVTFEIKDYYGEEEKTI